MISRRALQVLLLMLAATLPVLSAAPAAHGWHDEGHHQAAFESVVRLPEDVPAFFRAAAPVIAHMALDPDVARHTDTPQLRAAEAPEHYIDLELLQDKPLPSTRYEYIALCNELDVNPKHAGMLPYAIMEWTQRLTMAFAEHRKWPNDPAIHAKCLVYAGILTHYTADLAMPLHTTIHFDGRAGEDNRSPNSGIHAKVDALLGKWSDDQWLTLHTPAPVAIGNSWTYVLGELARSHDRVDWVYELEPQLPAEDQPIGSDPQLRLFVFESAHRATSITTQMLYTAWLNSAKIRLDPNHDRAMERPTTEQQIIPALPDMPPASAVQQAPAEADEQTPATRGDQFNRSQPRDEDRPQPEAPRDTNTGAWQPQIERVIESDSRATVTAPGDSESANDEPEDGSTDAAPESGSSETSSGDGSAADAPQSEADAAEAEAPAEDGPAEERTVAPGITIIEVESEDEAEADPADAPTK